MNLYTIMSEDCKSEVLCDVRIKEVAAFMGITNNYVSQLVRSGKARSGYRVVVSQRNIRGNQDWKDYYSRSHNRTEYYKEYYMRRKYAKAKRNVERT